MMAFETGIYAGAFATTGYQRAGRLNHDQAVTAIKLCTLEDSTVGSTLVL